MWRLGNLRAWRAVLLLCALSCAPAGVHAAPLNSPGAVDGAGADVPFGLSTAAISSGPMLQKWLGVERDVASEQQVLKICEQDRASCPSEPAREFLAIVDSAKTLQGRARLGEINRAINLKIKSMSDMALYGLEDVWSSPLATFAAGAGDCEDYAIAKFVALQQAGVAADDLRIVVLRHDILDEDHAVVAARLDGNWLMLDNLHMMMVEDQNVRGYHPLFLIDRNGVKLYFDKPNPEGSRGYDRPVGQILR
jgi:predicted transglutaminase-like cysteine proteinase